MGNEIWKDIIGFEGVYQVSNLGRVKSIDREVNTLVGWHRTRMKRKVKGRILSQCRANHGYLMTSLGCQKHRRVACTHQLVAEAFLGPRPNGCEVCHEDGNRDNNVAANLRWDTRKNNHADKKEHGTHLCGETQNGAKLRNAQIPSVLRMLKTGKTQAEVARVFNVGRGVIERIAKGKSYTDAPRK